MFENIRMDYALHGRKRNPALWHLVIYRFGRWAMELKFAPLRWLLLRIYGVLNFFISEMFIGIFMYRHVRVGKGFHIIHPEGVRIHTSAVIGDRVGIMQGVTIAQNMFPEAVPVIGNDVFIGARATVIGKIKIGDGVRIAANSLVISDIPAGAMAIGVPAKILRVPAAVHPGRRNEQGLPGNYPPQKITLASLARPQARSAADAASFGTPPRADP